MRPALIHSVILIAVLCPACPDLLLSRAAAQTAATDPTIPQTHDNDSTTATAAPEAIRQFELQIRPLLAARCYECHDGSKQKGGLRLDTPSAILAGGESGPAVVRGNPAESLLIQAVRYEGYQMPPTGQLPAVEIQLLVDWVQSGAAMPVDSGAAPRPPQSGFTDDDRRWWAIQPLAQPTVPQVSGTHTASVRNDVDRFLLSAMQQAGLSPAPEADPATLIRRVTFDLTGLPPTPQQIREFQADQRPDAWERLVDRLLQSDAYGERWARQWLDVVRYADSDGYRADGYRPDAWRYRDYVIDSLNQDKSYDRFVQEQLAGDELFPDSPDALVATGFLRHWIYEYNNRDARGQWDLILNEVTDTTADVFLGLGLQCARCHDHKYDPLLQRDYFRLRAVFAGLLPKDGTVIASTAQLQSHQQALQQWQSATADIRTRIAQLEQPYRDDARIKAIEMFPPDIEALLKSAPQELSPLEQQLYHLAWRQVDYEYEVLDNRIKGAAKERLLELRKQLAEFDRLKPESLPTALVVTDIGPQAPPTIIPKKQQTVLPGVPQILQASELPVQVSASGQTTGRRAALARWLTNPANPLAARVMVNRIWQGHFGRGLAPNASDFGTLGGPPTHPELLDWLTGQFLQQGWRLKPLHRLLVTSAAYRQSAEHPQMSQYQVLDPKNQWYWRGDVRRLDAEQIRDAILAVTGQLDRKAGGPGVNSDVPRRSIYLRVMRNARDPLLDVFDLPQFFASTAARDTTTSPVQSLLLFNSQMMLNHAGRLAGHLLPNGPSGERFSDDLLHELWLSAWGRNPQPAELAAARRFLDQQMQQMREDTERQSEAGALPVGSLPARPGQALLLNPDQQAPRMAAHVGAQSDTGGFTIESCFQLRSVFDSGAVRTIAARWDGNPQHSGWVFGVTGKGSRRKPQTLVLQLFGRTVGGVQREAALFSDHTVEFNVPYFAAVTVRPAKSESEPGEAVFYLRNLANEDEPISVVSVPLDLAAGLQNELPVSIGYRPGADSQFDGLLDDVRLSSAVLLQDELLLTREAPGPTTLAFWRFEAQPGILRDSSAAGAALRLQSGIAAQTTEQSAVADLCHVLLNSSEFLYLR